QFNPSAHGPSCRRSGLSATRDQFQGYVAGHDRVRGATARCRRPASRRAFRLAAPGHWRPSGRRPAQSRGTPCTQTAPQTLSVSESATAGSTKTTQNKTLGLKEVPFVSDTDGESGQAFSTATVNQPVSPPIAYGTNIQ